MPVENVLAKDSSTCIGGKELQASKNIKSRPGQLSLEDQQMDWEDQSLQREVMSGLYSSLGSSLRTMGNHWTGLSVSDKTQLMFLKCDSTRSTQNESYSSKINSNEMGGLDQNGRVDMEKREGLELYFGDRINRTMDRPRCGGKEEGHHMSPALGQICIVRKSS